jgi:phospholipid transport system substrate-binding protein
MSCIPHLRHLERRTGRRTVLAVVAVLAAWPGIARAAPSGPEAFVASGGQRAIAVSRRAGQDAGARRGQIAALLEEVADVERIARLSLGRHWREASEAQRRAFVDLYRGYLLDGIASRLGASEGIEKVAVLRSEKARGDSMVSTEIGLGPGQPPMQVDLRVRPVGDGYRIVDVVAEGVSLVVTNRSTFGAIVARGGIDGLLAELKRWSAEARAAS